MEAAVGHRRVEFGDAMALFVKNYANFQGRSSRGALWWALLACQFIGSALIMIDHRTFDAEVTNIWTTPGLVFGAATLIPTVSVAVRRMHDIGKSGWWLLFCIVPVPGLVMMMVFWAKPGMRGENQFGRDQEAGR